MNRRVLTDPKWASHGAWGTQDGPHGSLVCCPPQHRTKDDGDEGPWRASRGHRIDTEAEKAGVAERLG